MCVSQHQYDCGFHEGAGFDITLSILANYVWQKLYSMESKSKVFVLGLCPYSMEY